MLKYLGKIIKTIKNFFNVDDEYTEPLNNLKRALELNDRLISLYEDISKSNYEMLEIFDKDPIYLEGEEKEKEILKEQITNALSSKVKDKNEYSEEFVREYYENLPDEYDYNGLGRYYKNKKDA